LELSVNQTYRIELGFVTVARNIFVYLSQLSTSWIASASFKSYIILKLNIVLSEKIHKFNVSRF